MARHVWRTTDSVIEALAKAPWRFEFAQAVRLLELARPGCTATGTSSRTDGEAVRFRSSLTTAFPASDIDSLALAKDGGSAAMAVNFLGLAGVFGPLPASVTELLVARSRRRDTAGRDFLDIFNHRLVSLAMRVERSHKVALQPGRPEDRAFATWLFAVLGLATPGLRSPLRRPRSRLLGLDRSLMEFAGLLARRPVSLHALEAVLARHFGIAVTGHPLQGRWLSLARDQVTVLGRAGRNQGLGTGAVLGARIWDQQAALRLDLGPMEWRRFRTFLPGRAGHRALTALTRFISDGVTDVEARLLLSPDQAPPSRLGLRQDGNRPRLGWTSWLGRPPQDRPAAITLRLASAFP